MFGLCLAGCKPWTIRPIENKGQPSAAAAQQLNVDAYLASIWDSKLVPQVLENAVELSQLLAACDADFEAAKKQYGLNEAGGAPHFMVKGKGRVNRFNSNSQNRTVSISLPNYGGKTDVALQLGPVFRGTAIRDAVGFIQFNQFINQLQFAEVANKLNDRVFSLVVKDFDAAAAQGQSLSFYGVFTMSDRSKIVITPVKLELQPKTGGKD